MNELPKNWYSATLEELGQLHCGQSPPSDTVNQRGRGQPYVTGPEQWDGRTLHLNKWTESPKRIVPDGCIFITVKGAGVGTLFPGVACAIGRDVYAFEPHAPLQRDFIRYALAETIEELKREASGLIPGLARTDLLPHRVALPPLNEQRRIVDKIEALNAKSRRAKAALEAIPPLLEKFRQSILAAAFRGDLTADWRAKNPDVEPASNLLERIRTERRRRWEEAELEKLRAKGTPPKDDRWKAKYQEPAAAGAGSDGDEYPVTWGSVILEAGCDPVRGIPYGVVQTGDHTPNGVPTVRCGDIKGFKIGVETLKRISPDLAKEYARTELLGGEVLLAIRGTVGATAVAPIELRGCNISREVAMIPPLPGIDSAFLSYFLAAPTAQAVLQGHIKGVAQSGVNLTDLRRLCIPVPPLEEQRIVVERIRQVLTKISTMTNQHASCQSALQSLASSILAKAFRGELVPQDPADEPASALLERIRADREGQVPASSQRIGRKRALKRHAAE